jgi:hypothetical protein
MDLILKNNHFRAKTAILELWTVPEDDIEMTIKKEKAWVRESLDNLKGLFEL